MTWQPVSGHYMTRWAKNVTPENAWQEYPRPQMRRRDWLNLNGLWNFAIKKETTISEEEKIVNGDFFKKNLESSPLRGEILVPFPIESALSGVKCALQSDETLIYQRIFSIPVAWDGKRTLLHFGAVDWEAKVLVNGRHVGRHVGGYLPFWFDITDVLVEGENELIVCVCDPTDTFWQQRGKQVLQPKTIWYTAVSGIWQTVWLEPVTQTYISRVKITPDVDGSFVSVKAILAGSQLTANGLNVRILDAGKSVAFGESTPSETEIRIPIPNPILWSPDLPHLYDLEITSGEDQVESYFGMRKFSIEERRLCLNNRPLFQFGPLDQGYWPDGLYTPPSDEAMHWDIGLVKKLGCNMLRKHVKVEPARYYHYCDIMGIIVWQDMPNGGAVVDEMSLFLENLENLPHGDRNYRLAGREKISSREDFKRELCEMVDHLHNFTCIGMWVPFNEAWGQFEAKAIAEWLKNYDPTRPIDHASGWFDQGGGDCNSLHIYSRKLKPKKAKKHRALVLSEFGGYSLKITGHLWNPMTEFGYKKFSTSEALTEAYLDLLERELKPWVHAGLSAAVYTQTSDVEIEVNGYITYDREVEKMDFEKVRRAHLGFWI